MRLRLLPTCPRLLDGFRLAQVPTSPQVQDDTWSHIEHTCTALDDVQRLSTQCNKSQFHLTLITIANFLGPWHVRPRDTRVCVRLLNTNLHRNCLRHLHLVLHSTLLPILLRLPQPVSRHHQTLAPSQQDGCAGKTTFRHRAFQCLHVSRTAVDSSFFWVSGDQIPPHPTLSGRPSRLEIMEAA